jgi:hypothetical protein
MLSHIDFTVVALAAVAGVATGAVWYGVLGTWWKRAHGMGPEGPKPGIFAFALWALGNLVAAFLLADLLADIGDASGPGGLVAGVLLGVGFCVPYMAMSNAFAGKPLALTLIDGGHAVAALAATGLVIGAMS